MAAIDAAVSLSPLSEERLLAACINERTIGPVVLVIEEAGDVLGFVVYDRVLDEVTVHEIAVRAEYARGEASVRRCYAVPCRRCDESARLAACWRCESLMSPPAAFISAMGSV